MPGFVWFLVQATLAGIAAGARNRRNRRHGGNNNKT